MAYLKSSIRSIHLRSGKQSSSSLRDVYDDYGVEEIGLSGVDLNDDEDIVIPPICFMIPNPGSNMAVLAGSIDPLSDSSNFGINLYQKTLSIFHLRSQYYIAIVQSMFISF